MTVTAYDIAARYAGPVYERKGGQTHPFIAWCFSLCGYGLDTPDEIPWCSAFAQHAPWELRLPRSKSAAARSWLGVGRPQHVGTAEIGFDVVILKRGGGDQPGPEVLSAQGHVGLYAGYTGGNVLVLGGNQGDAVSIAPFDSKLILGIRRLTP